MLHHLSSTGGVCSANFHQIFHSCLLPPVYPLASFASLVVKRKAAQARLFTAHHRSVLLVQVAERMTERVSERVTERIAERAGERVAERAGERILERVRLMECWQVLPSSLRSSHTQKDSWEGCRNRHSC